MGYTGMKCEQFADAAGKTARTSRCSCILDPVLMCLCPVFFCVLLCQVPAGLCCNFGFPFHVGAVDSNDGQCFGEINVGSP